MPRKSTMKHLKLVHSTSDAKIQREIRRKQREFEKTLPPMPKKVVRELKKLGFEINPTIATIYDERRSDPIEVPWFYFEKRIELHHHYIKIHPQINAEIYRWLKYKGRIETTHLCNITSMKWIDYEYGPGVIGPTTIGAISGRGAYFNKDPITVTFRDAPALVDVIWSHLYELQRID